MKNSTNPNSKRFNRVYVIGVFDLYHRGHVELFRRSKELGNELIVAVNGDDMVASYKRRPIYNEQDRLALVQSCRHVDDAFVISEYDNKGHIKRLNIDAIVHGDDWELDSYLEQIRVTPEFLVENGVEMVFLPYCAGISTSDIIKRLRSSNT